MDNVLQLFQGIGPGYVQSVVFRKGFYSGQTIPHIAVYRFGIDFHRIISSFGEYSLFLQLTDLVLQAGGEPFHVPVMVGQSVLADTVFHCLSHERVAVYFASEDGTDMFHLIIPHGLYILQILLNLRNSELRVVITYCLFQPCPVECGNLFSEYCFGRHISVGMACHDEIVFTFMPSAFTFLQGNVSESYTAVSAVVITISDMLEIRFTSIEFGWKSCIFLELHDTLLEMTDIILVFLT